MHAREMQLLIDPLLFACSIGLMRVHYNNNDEID